MNPENSPAGADAPPQASAPAGGGFIGEMRAIVTAEVQHHAPCVAECPVCYPEGGKPA